MPQEEDFIYEVPDYTNEDLNSFLTKSTSILEETGVINDLQDISFDRLIPGVAGRIDRTNGLQFLLDKTNNLTILQSRNFVANTTGWRLDSDGVLQATSGTLTGLTVQTSTSGARIVIDNDTITSYDSSGNERVRITDDEIRFNQATGVFGSDFGFIKLLDADSFEIALITGGSTTSILLDNDTFLKVSVRGAVIPRTTNTYDLGTSALAWKDLYLHDGTDEWRIEIDTSGVLQTTKV